MISKSSGLDTALIPFTYATEPADVDVDKLNPCEFPAPQSESPYLAFLIVGATPSNPSWKPTMNCLLLISDAVSDVDNEYPKFLVETTPATIAVMLASNENAVFPPCVADVGIGAK